MGNGMIRQDGSLTERGKEIKALAHLPAQEISSRFGLSVATVRAYLSTLRARGHIADREEAERVSIVISHDQARRLRQELARRGRARESLASIIEDILALIQADDMYDAIIDDDAARSAPVRGATC